MYKPILKLQGMPLRMDLTQFCIPANQCSKYPFLNHLGLNRITYLNTHLKNTEETFFHGQKNVFHSKRSLISRPKKQNKKNILR